MKVLILKAGFSQTPQNKISRKSFQQETSFSMCRPQAEEQLRRDRGLYLLWTLKTE
jgi:hypothetical protein